MLPIISMHPSTLHTVCIFYFLTSNEFTCQWGDYAAIIWIILYHEIAM